MWTSLLSIPYVAGSQAGMLNKLISSALLFLVLAQGAFSVSCGADSPCPSGQICCATETQGVNTPGWPGVQFSHLSEKSVARELKETLCCGVCGGSHVRRHLIMKIICILESLALQHSRIENPLEKRHLVCLCFEERLHAVIHIPVSDADTCYSSERGSK
ncbi:hypothetical protein B0H19DRAFT_708982 [Mycena capillaripes]|nr:hypothetical protein B0H19DRAFT_708982 [Mycena capillaripes]